MRATEFISETINSDIENPNFKHSIVIDGLVYKAVVEPNKFDQTGGQRFSIYCMDMFERAGVVRFAIKENTKGEQWLESAVTYVNPNYRGKNIASNMYAYAKMLGNDIRPSKDRTQMGKDMWSAWSKSGEAKYLKR
jgi:hypothetical protein